MRTRFAHPAILALWLVATAVAALALRVLPGLRLVDPAAGDGADSRLVFREADPWYHVRAIEHQVANFPERFAFDPYLGFPDGGDVPVAPLLDWTVAALARATGGARPSVRGVETVAAWFPAVAGALLVFPGALLARRLAAGLASTRERTLAAATAAGFVALAPGQLLGRSLFGFTDHHVLELLFSTTLLAALAGALDAAGSPRARARSAILAGASLAAFLLTWLAGAVIVLLLSLWIALQFAVDVAGGRTPDWLERVVLPMLGAALLVVAPLHDGITVPDRSVAALVAALAGTLALAGAARLGTRRRFHGSERRATFGFALAFGAVLLAAGASFVPGATAQALGELRQLVLPGDLSGTVAESAPLHTQGRLLPLLWNEFALAGPLALALVLVGLRSLASRRAAPARAVLLFAVWSCGLLLLAFAKNRFLYYLAVPVAVAAALAVSRLAGWLERRPPPAEQPKAQRTISGSGPPRAGRSVVVAAGLLAVLGAGLPPALARAREWSGPSRDWRAALDWLRTSTPEPFADPLEYWRARRRDDPARPSAGYAVGAWWDYGYWILRGAHRVPAATPTQAGAPEMARLLVAQDDVAAAAIADRAGIRFLLLDAELPMLPRRAGAPPSGKFRSVARFAGEPFERYIERVVRRDPGGELKTYALFHPDYYRTLLVRLYQFGGAAVEVAGAVHVAELAPAAAAPADTPRELVRLAAYPSHAAALAALAGRDPERFRIVGLDPLVPCVPIGPSAHFRRVYGSPAARRLAGRRVSEIEIFERPTPARSAG